jgi:hypothetical protein
VYVISYQRGRFLQGATPDAHVVTPAPAS